MSNTANINNQLRSLIREGLTEEQACKTLGIEIEAGQMALMSMADAKSGKEVTILELINKHKPEAIQVLLEVMRTGERDSDRVKAAQIILEGRGVMPEISASAASQLFERFSALRKNLEGVIVEAEVVESTPEGGLGLSSEVISMGK